MSISVLADPKGVIAQRSSTLNSTNHAFRDIALSTRAVLKNLGMIPMWTRPMGSNKLELAEFRAGPHGLHFKWQYIMNP